MGKEEQRYTDLAKAISELTKNIKGNLLISLFFIGTGAYLIVEVQTINFVMWLGGGLIFVGLVLTISNIGLKMTLQNWLFLSVVMNFIQVIIIVFLYSNDTDLGKLLRDKADSIQVLSQEKKDIEENIDKIKGQLSKSKTEKEELELEIQKLKKTKPSKGNEAQRLALLERLEKLRNEQKKDSMALENAKLKYKQLESSLDSAKTEISKLNLLVKEKSDSLLVVKTSEEELQRQLGNLYSNLLRFQKINLDDIQFETKGWNKKDGKFKKTTRAKNVDRIRLFCNAEIPILEQNQKILLQYLQNDKVKVEQNLKKGINYLYVKNIDIEADKGKVRIVLNQEKKDIPLMTFDVLLK